uniref:LAGLIDADG endonuclease n=1 Tax=Cubamyces lactineus TaxID=1391043 RepID=UPI0030010A85|nr:LAGLIDADG endonuclease [Cubamyces lactineus]
MTKLYTIPLVTVPSGFKFNLFYSLYVKRYPNTPSKSFLEWVIGFTEGDGSFVLNSRGTPVFVITQSTSDIQILHYIQQTLGFGRVIKQGPRTSRFVVEDIASITLLVALFNGNLVFPLKQASFSRFLKAFNNRSKDTKVMFISTLITPTLNDNWLCGFTDAEGCFTCSLLGNSKAYRFRYKLAQLGCVAVLNHLTTVIGGVVRPQSAKEVNELTVNGVRNMTRVFNYFDRHELQTKKAKSYKLWREVHLSLIKGEHLLPESRAVLKAKAAIINSNK